MISLILQAIFNFVLFVIQKIGYVGVFILMALESVNIPIPSEVIMPFSGFLVQKEIFSFWMVVLAGTFGNLFGSLISYCLAHSLVKLVKRRFEERYWLVRILVNHRSLKFGEKWFEKYGDLSIFLSRLLPVVRTFISFPAGLSKMKLSTFSILTFAGSFIWSIALTWLGFVLGENWLILRFYFEKFDYLILFLILTAIIFWIWHQFLNNKRIIEQ